MSTMSQASLEGQRALVTGATSAIGRAVALEYADDYYAAPSGDLIRRARTRFPSWSRDT
jgi:NAD(P)-dependent dehydrogenase (short-subunit alcohol dehydrogenase family)